MPRPKGSGNKTDWVKMAIAGIEAQIKELTGVRDQLSALSPGAVAAAAAAPAATRVTRKRRGAKKTAKAAKAVKATKSAKPVIAGKKRKVSAETRRKLKEAAKARWARARGEAV